MLSSGIYCDESGSAPCIYGSPPGESDSSEHTPLFVCRLLWWVGLRCVLSFMYRDGRRNGEENRQVQFLAAICFLDRKSCVLMPSRNLPVASPQ